MGKGKVRILAVSSVLVALLTIVGGQVSDAMADKGVQELGKFAVEESNKGKQQKVEFGKVVQAAKKVDSGTKYYLRIEGSENGEKKSFNAEVLLKPSKEKEMLSFAPTKL